MGATDFRVEGADQLVALSKSLRESGNKVLMKSLRKRLSAVTKPIVAEVRAAAKAIPSQGAHSSGHRARSAMSKRGNDGSLRKALARAVQSKVLTSGKTATVAIRLNGAKMPGDQKELPALMEGLTPWRHPIFGDPDVWVAQSSHPFFYKTLKKNESKVQSEVARVLDDVANEITK